MPDAPNRFEGSGRVRDVGAVDPELRHLYLAAQMDALELRMSMFETRIDDRLKQIQASQAKNLWTMIAVLVSMMTLSLTLLVQGAFGP
jgi:hypothetical protein